MLTVVKAKIHWWKHNQNSILHKLLAMLFSSISPTLIFEIENAKWLRKEKQIDETKEKSNFN